MIRYALAFLGLSAGAVSAPASVQAASVAPCGPQIEVMADVCGGEAGAREGSSAPQTSEAEAQAVLVPARAVEQGVAADTGQPKGLVALKRGFDGVACAPRIGHGSLHPYRRDVVFAGPLDGSDPSAMFCP